MALPPYRSDLICVLKGLSRLGSAATEIQSKDLYKTYANSFVRPIAEKGVLKLQDCASFKNLKDVNIQKKATEAYERLFVVKEGFKAYASGTVGENMEDSNFKKQISEMNLSQSNLEEDKINKQHDDPSRHIMAMGSKNNIYEKNEISENFDLLSSVQGLKKTLDVGENISQTVSEVQEEVKGKVMEFDNLLKISKNSDIISEDQLDAISSKLEELRSSEFNYDLKIISEAQSHKVDAEPHLSNYELSNMPINKHIIKPLNNYVDEAKLKPPKLLQRKPLAKDKAQSTLSSDAQARKVPESRLSRLFTFGSLAAGLGVGTLAEMTRRKLGIKNINATGALMDASSLLNGANARRIVDTLCKVRGAALKLGQMLSIQDNTLINPHVQKIFERVRQSADFMPTWQLERTLIQDFGPNWRSLVASFDDVPFAAASIGQVHQAVLLDGRSVAMKIQYPGVAQGIESDINNLIGALGVAKLVPEGLFVETAIEVAKKELRWECDYEREKACTVKFRELVSPYPEYYVPDVVDELCTKQVFTTELIEGISVDKCINLEQETRNYICTLVLRLCLMELFHFGFMQTDPNWSNFFYNTDTQQLALVDFGACREYNKNFVDDYINVIHGAATKDREKVAEYSKHLGFLTGYEPMVMVNAHIDAVMILGEAFQEDKPFDFGHQDTTRRIQRLVPVMLAHRMCPPPEESYSLHRKMSGVFLLCAKLNGKINCKSFFDQLLSNYEAGGTWDDIRCKKLHV